ncbi:MAG: hypothetical protein AAF763_00035 [Pseudomonadota bacterium]
MTGRRSATTCTVSTAAAGHAPSLAGLTGLFPLVAFQALFAAREDGGP